MHIVIQDADDCFHDVRFPGMILRLTPLCILPTVITTGAWAKFFHEPAGSTYIWHVLYDYQ